MRACGMLYSTCIMQQSSLPPVNVWVGLVSDYLLRPFSMSEAWCVTIFEHIKHKLMENIPLNLR